MEVLVLAVDKPSLEYAARGVELYKKRLRGLSKTELRYVRGGCSKEVSARLLRASEGYVRIAVDERGKNMSTRELVNLWKEWQLNSVRRIAFMIGAAEGHSDELRAASDLVLSFGRHTMQHELALVVLLEQIYRVHTLLGGLPYHRD